MSVNEKYFGTLVLVYGSKYDKLKELGYSGYGNHFRIICKAKSISEANRIAESYGLGERVFNNRYATQTRNKLEMELSDKYGFIINVDGTINNSNYIDIKEIINQ